jgi:hypothetical protein
MDGLELLHEANALVARGWCQGAEARDIAGGGVDACSMNAVEWSLLGALQAVAFRDDLTEIEDIGLAVAMIAELIEDPSLAGWNDDAGRSQRQVCGLLGRAEQLAAEQIGLEPAPTYN